MPGSITDATSITRRHQITIAREVQASAPMFLAGPDLGALCQAALTDVLQLLIANRTATDNVRAPIGDVLRSAVRIVHAWAEWCDVDLAEITWSRRSVSVGPFDLTMITLEHLNVALRAQLLADRLRTHPQPLGNLHMALLALGESLGEDVSAGAGMGA